MFQALTDRNFCEKMFKINILFIIYYLFILFLLQHSQQQNSSSSTTTTEKERGEFSEYLISYLYKNYPDFLTTIMERYYTPAELAEQRNSVYKGYILEMKRKNEYELLLADTYKQNYRQGIFESGEMPTTTLYKCQSPIRYCSGNPRYCELREGDFDTNLILIVPHGGKLETSRIPNRDAGCYINDTCFYDHRCESKQYGHVKNFTLCAVEKNVDMYTKEIALSIAEHYKKITGKRPHIVMSNLHRKKVDVNRGISRGTFNVYEAERAWIDFQEFVDYAKNMLPGKRGLIIDIHGNNHHKNWNMLGYGLTSTHLNFDILQPNLTTIKNLGESLDIPFKQLITGKNSLAYFMQRNGIPAMPSLDVENPGNDSYYSGGYIIHRHGSMFGGKVDAIQMEINEQYRQPDKLDIFSSGFAKSLAEFIDLNYLNRGHDSNTTSKLNATKSSNKMKDIKVKTSANITDRVNSTKPENLTYANLPNREISISILSNDKNSSENVNSTNTNSPNDRNVTEFKNLSKNNLQNDSINNNFTRIDKSKTEENRTSKSNSSTNENFTKLINPLLQANITIVENNIKFLASPKRSINKRDDDTSQSNINDALFIDVMSTNSSARKAPKN